MKMRESDSVISHINTLQEINSPPMGLTSKKKLRPLPSFQAVRKILSEDGSHDQWFRRSSSLDCHIHHVRASSQTFANVWKRHVWAERKMCSFFLCLFPFSCVFITNLARNIDHSQFNQTCQSNQTLSLIYNSRLI